MSANNPFDRRLRQAAERAGQEEEDEQQELERADRRLREAADRADRDQEQQDDEPDRQVRPGRGTEDRVVEREPSPEPEPTPSPDPSPPPRRPDRGARPSPEPTPEPEPAPEPEPTPTPEPEQPPTPEPEPSPEPEPVDVSPPGGGTGAEPSPGDGFDESDQVESFREQVREENPDARNIEISRENGELVATFESPQRDPDPVSEAARGAVEDVSGVDLPTENELVGDLNRAIQGATGIDLPTEREFILGTQQGVEGATGVDLPTEAELTRRLRRGAFDLTGVDLPTDEEVAAGAQETFQDVTGVSDRTFAIARDPASLIAAGAPIAAAEPTPFGEAALFGLAVGAGVAAEGDRLDTAAVDVPVETVRDRPEVPVDRFGLPDEISIPTDEFGGGVDLPEGVIEETPEIPTPTDGDGFGTGDGEIPVPEDGTGAGTIQAGGVLVDPEELEDPEPEFDEEDIFRGPEPITGGERSPDVEQNPFESPFGVDGRIIDEAETPDVTQGGFLQERLEQLREDVGQSEITDEADETDIGTDFGTEIDTGTDFPPFGGFDVDIITGQDIIQDTTPDDFTPPEDIAEPPVFETPPFDPTTTRTPTSTTTTTTETVTEQPTRPGRTPGRTSRPIEVLPIDLEDDEDDERFFPVEFEGVQEIEAVIDPTDLEVD